MSKINFKLLVEQILNESLLEDLTPQTADSNLNKIDVVLTFLKQLLFREKGTFIKKGTRITYKPIWPYADTVDYIRNEMVKLGLISNDSAGIDRLGEALLYAENAAGIIQDLTKDKTDFTKDIANVEKDINNKILYLTNNIGNYRNYFNLTLKQDNDQTSIIAAEKYLNKNPLDAIIDVIVEFGGYDDTLAENIVKYPGENKYTQKADYIDNIVMKNIIEIAKTLLIFYREFIQYNAQNILEYIKYDLTDDSKWFTFKNVTPRDLAQLTQIVAGKTPEDLGSAAKAAGIENVPTDALANYIHNDFILFIAGQSTLVLENYSIGENVKPTPLIQTVDSFKTFTGTGQEIYQSFIHLFNNMKKGELPSKWKTGVKIGSEITSDVMQSIGDIGSAMAAFNRGL